MNWRKHTAISPRARRRLLLAGALGMLAGCAPVERPAPPEKAPLPGPAAAGVPMAALSGQEGDIHLGDYRGKVVLLDFWATWCAPCLAEQPALQALRESFPENDFALLGLAVDRGSRDAVAGAVSRVGPSYPVGWADAGVQKAYGGIRVVPTKFLLDRKGNIVKKYEGIVPEETLRTDIQALLDRR